MRDSNGFVSPVRHAFLSEKGVLGFGWVGGLLVFVALTGVGMWLLPFGVYPQVVTLLHTALGILMAPAFAVWQLSHWLGTRKAPRRSRKVAGYVGFWLLAASCASGLVLAWQAVFGLHIGGGWDQIHLWTGIASLPLLAWHLVPAPARNGVNYGPARRRMWRLAAGSAGALAALSAAIALAWLNANPAAKDDRDYGRDFFAPSNSNTVDGRPIAAGVLANSASCGTSDCHSAIYEEWRASAHRWSAEDHFFQAVRSAVTDLHGTGATIKCGGCHDPVSLLSGHKDPKLGPGAPGYKEGDSCVVCHALRRADERGIGSYTIGAPRAYLYDYATAGFGKFINHFLVRAYPAQHSSDYNLAPVKRPDSCAPCHKEFDVVDEKLGPVQVETQYDDWKTAKWNTERDPAKRLYCQQCHMYYVEGAPDAYDAKAGLGASHRNHWFAAGNQYMPGALASPDAAAQAERVTEWLHGKREVKEIAKVWPQGPVIPMKLVAPDAAAPGGVVKLQVVVTNQKAGHSFPTGPLNIVRSWVEVIVRDAAGAEIYHSGGLDDGWHIEPGSYIIRPVAIDLKGRQIMMPDLWHPAGPKFKQAIPPGKSETFDYEFKAPAGAKGPLSVEARLRYRKANQFFMDSVYGRGRVTTPVTDVSGARAEIALMSK
jgi:hypothetical protein